MQAYSVPSRESDPHSLPDVEVFYVDEVETVDEFTVFYEHEAGWYWWPCFPGCLPDGDPVGPFGTEELALSDAQEGGVSNVNTFIAR